MSESMREFLKKMQEFFPSTRDEYLESVKKYGKVLETAKQYMGLRLYCFK